MQKMKNEADQKLQGRRAEGLSGLFNSQKSDVILSGCLSGSSSLLSGSSFL